MRNPSSSGTKTPCCSKVGIKKGPWTPEEDEVLSNYVKKEGEGRWRTLPKRAGLLRCGKSCRLRWMNYLRPSVKRGRIAADEEDLILRLHRLLGNRWSLIAGRIPGRTDNEIKNYWNTHLSKKLISQGIDPRTHKPLNPIPTSTEVNEHAHDPHLASSSNPNPNLPPLEMQETGGRYQASGENFNSDPSCYENHEAQINDDISPIDGFMMGILPSSHGHKNHEDVYTEDSNEDAFSSFLDYLISDNMFVNQQQEQHQQQQLNMDASSSTHQHPSSAPSFNHGAIDWEAANDTLSTVAALGDQQNDAALDNHLA